MPLKNINKFHFLKAMSHLLGGIFVTLLSYNPILKSCHIALDMKFLRTL